ncbi:MAG: hypothetical protein IJ247_05980 [Bacilli bacterium]|nr:hypothetical protein [Bacilli bacterium]
MNVALSAVALPLIFVFIIGFALISYFKKKPHPEYKVKTGPGRRYSILFSIIFWLGLVLLWVAFFLQFSSEFPIDFCWIFILLGGLFSLLSLGALSLITFQYEAIKGDEVVIRKFKNKIIPISSIAQISPINVGIYFLDKDGKKLFSIASMSANIDQFVSTLVEKNEILSKNFKVVEGYGRNGRVVKGLAISDEVVDSSPIFENIGKEYRLNKNKRRRSAIFIGLIISFAVIIAGALLFILGSQIMAFLVSPFIVLGPVISILAFNRRERNEANWSDKQLGVAKYNQSTKVKGSAQRRKRSATIAFIIFFLVFGSLGVGSFLLGYFSPILKQEEMQKVEGKLVSVYEGAFDDYLTLNVEGNDYEYRISLDYFSNDKYEYFTSSFVSNDDVTLYASTSSNTTATTHYQGKLGYKNAYLLSTSKGDFITYEDYYAYEKRSNDRFIIIGFVLMPVAIVSIGVYLYFMMRYSKEQKEEIYNAFSN